MRKLVIGLGAIVGILLLSGCSGKSPNMHKRGTHVIKVQGRHYITPSGSYSRLKIISKAYANVQKNMIGCIGCRVGDIRVYAQQDTGQKMFDEIYAEWKAKWTKAEQAKGKPLTQKERQAILTPIKKDVQSRVIKEGKIMCVRPQPWSWTKQRNRYEAQQRRINNDPRVIAARIQANAINNAAYANQWNNSPGIKPYVAPTSTLNFMNEKLTTTSMQSGSTSYSVRPMGSDHYRVKERRSAPKW